MSALEQLKQMTVIVADTGDFECEYNRAVPETPTSACATSGTGGGVSSHQ